MGDWTKGPWSSEGRFVIAADGGNVCSATAIRDEWHDNVRLIAAAPDLAEALRDLDPGNPRRTDCNERKCGECSTCRARAALAKAEGRSS